MDLSVVAAVGSFVVSERVMRAKATILAGLACVLVYDLAVHTHDPSSRRVYRGPAMVSFTLMCCALSLRTWRRSGVACDELLFLPGTPHAERHGVPCPSQHGERRSPPPRRDRRRDVQSSASSLSMDAAEMCPMVTSEGDAAAGGMFQRPKPPSPPRSQGSAASGDLEMTPILSPVAVDLEAPGADADADADDDETSLDIVELCAQPPKTSGPNGTDDDRGQTAEAEADGDDSSAPAAEDDNLWKSLLCGANRRDEYLKRRQGSSPSRPSTPDQGSVSRRRVPSGSRPPSPHPDESNDQRRPAGVDADAPYAPSGPNVAGAALDLGLPTIFNFHLFVLASNYTYGADADEGNAVPPQVLPLVFLTILMVRLTVPPSSRRRFWSTLKYTVCAPLFPVIFRDAFLADVMTSLVRPMQDVVFAFFYYCTVLWRITSGTSVADAVDAVEESFLLHDVMLPACTILTLWWKFMQTLRLSFDTGRRWPYFGDAFKYMSASLVIFYAMAHSEGSRSPVWKACFLAATIYQIWWDTVMDWDLFVFGPESRTAESETSTLSARNENEEHQRLTGEGPETSPGVATSAGSDWFNVSSSSPEVFLPPLHRYFLQPGATVCRRIRLAMPWPSGRLMLRKQRLFSNDNFYWRIFFANAMLRFVWMLNFIPTHHFSLSTGKMVSTLSINRRGFVGVLLSAIEITRRCFWGILKVEVETIKMMDQDRSPDSADVSCEQTTATLEVLRIPASGGEAEELEMASPKKRVTNGRTRVNAAFFDDKFTRAVFISELVLWAAVFVVLGFWSAFGV